VLLCWLALLLIRVAERKTDQTWRRLALELGRLHLVTLSRKFSVVRCRVLRVRAGFGVRGLVWLWLRGEFDVE